MSYDGRDPQIPWRSQNIENLGYHYYMNPEIAEIGLQKLDKAIITKEFSTGAKTISNIIK